MQLVLVMFRPDGERRSFSIVRPVTVIGRRGDCDLRIPLHEASRKHCRLIIDGDEVRIEDLGSSNGTFVNGKRIQSAVLHPGDSIHIGSTPFIIQIDGEPSDEEIEAPAERTSGRRHASLSPEELANLLEDDESIDAEAASEVIPPTDESLESRDVED